MARQFGWRRTELASAASAAALASAFATPLFGRLIDAYGPRRIILISAIALAAAMAALSGIPRSYPLYIAAAFVIGVAGAGSTTFAYLSILPAWFDRRLGFALAIATIGFGLGQALGPLYANALIKHLGWRLAYAALGLSVLVVAVPNALLLLKDTPPGRSRAAHTGGEASGRSLPEALRMISFWCLAASVCLITMAVTGCTVHLIPLLTDRGVTATAAASAAALFGVSMLLTRFVSGILLDFVNAKLVGLILFCGVVVGLGLILTGGHGPLTLAGVCLLGAGLGVEADLIPYITRQVFGKRAYGTIYGFLFAAFNIGVVLGPLVMGISFDRFGGYSPGLTLLLALAGLAAGLLVVGLPRSRSHHEARPVESVLPPVKVDALSVPRA